MVLRDYLVALLIALIWGVNFVIIKSGVSDVPPLMFAALRFLFVSFPAIFFLKPPKAAAWIIAAYGFAVAIMQFGFVFSAISLGMPAGLTSLIVQSQMFFTIFLAWLVMGERPGLQQLFGGLIAFAGILVIASQRESSGGLLPFLLVVCGAASWGLGNVIGKLAGRVDMLAFTVWSSLIAPVPLLALSWYFEGAGAYEAVLASGLSFWLAVVYLAYLGTMLGYTLWSHLLSQHKASEVAPFSLLVPVFGLTSAQLFYAEPVSRVEWMGAGLVLAGLSWTVFGPNLRRRFRGSAGSV
jgi:O-acetylserine/cysteine efflux transporter